MSTGRSLVGPYDGDVHPFWAVMIGLAVGITIGVLIMVLGRRWAASPQVVPAPLDPLVEPPALPDEVAHLVGVLHASAMVVGPHDEVMCANHVAIRGSLAQRGRVVPDELLALIRRVRSTRQPVVADLDVPRGRGHATVRYAVRVAPLSDDLIIALAEDRTEARRVEEVRRDFVANVSHELKTPIGAISLLAETIADAADDPATVRRFAARMESESSRLSDLVRQIIELSRLQADDPLTDGDTIELDDLFAEVVDRVAVDVDARQVNLRVVGDPAAVVYGHRGQLTGAIANLVENAVVYSDPGAKVVIGARHRDGNDPGVEITVTDNGIGIPPEEQQRIFERFYRVDYARARADGGTGLGLAIVKHVIAAHGGIVDVWSRPGEGSTFTISIPDHPSLTGADEVLDTAPFQPGQLGSGGQGHHRAHGTDNRSDDTTTKDQEVRL